jgi:hypothetical protein
VLLGLTSGVAACDVASFVTDPKAPIFEQTWNLPMENVSMSVGSLLPTGVTIYSTPGSNPEDSSAFLVDIATVGITRRVGNDCAQCETLNGTNAFKPAFVLAAGNSQALPANMISGAILGGEVTVTLTNNMSFDPLRPRALSNPPQGFMLIVIRSGSLVLGRDSVNGDMPNGVFPQGATMTRTVSLSTGTVTGTLAVDVTLNSPVGDHNEFINANGTLNASADLDAASTGLPTLRVGNVTMNVVNRSINSGSPIELALDDLPDAIANNVVRGAFELTIVNPFAVAGTVNVDFAPTSGQNVTKPLSLPSGNQPQVRTVTLDKPDLDKIIGSKVNLTVSGAVNSTSPIVVTPRQVVSISNRLILTTHVGGK